MSKVSEEEGNEFIYGALGWGGGFKTEMTRGRACGQTSGMLGGGLL